jgi:esterase/lipase superfamily enzyme
MHIEEHRWHSPALGREMALKVYGHGGDPFIVFPCSRGRYFDYEGLGMIAAIAPFIDSGRIQLVCVDSVDGESWYDFGVPPARRNARYEAYDQYVTGEVVPFVRDRSQRSDARPMTNGCSMGAYHALNLFLKHPDLFQGTISLSGLYRLDRPEFGLGGHELADVYFNSPLTYLANLSDPWYLEKYGERTIIVCAGQGAWDEESLADTRDLAAICREKSIPAWIDIWGADVNHDWPWWYKQMNYFLGHLYR